MSEYLSINKIICWESESIDTKNIFQRILWTDPINDELIVIDINKANALPEIKCLSEIVSLLGVGSVRALEFYQKENFILIEDSIPEKWKKCRDKAWSIIKDIVQMEPDIYYRCSRGRLIEQAVLQNNTTKPSIYSSLRKYWQGGKTKNCLLPNYYKCGGKGLEKDACGKKRGRPRKSNDIEDKNVINEPGININNKVRKDISKAVKDFYNNTNKYPLKYTYEKMIFRDYVIGYKLIDGIEVPILKPEKDLPTFGQFKYWVKKDNNNKDIIIKREGENRYNLNYRPILGKSTLQAYGPGCRYQIDASHASVYLINSLTRKQVIKRATIYVVIDVFSRMIVGMYIGLENPSWIGAAMALSNAASDKVEYCKRYDINITHEQWPCTFLPELLTADRGELEGDKPDNLINTLGVDVEILPPYRADWKGIVESEFRKLDVAAILWLPGAIKKRFRERGEKDYRLGAALTLKEFSKILINCILFYNNKHRMNWYDRDEFQIAENIQPIPIMLWNWGMINRTGRLKQFPVDIIMLNLMPTAIATVTDKGIGLGKYYYYTCNTAETENWFQKARAGHSWKVPISFDPRNMNYIYIRLDGGKDYEKCYLLDSSVTFRNRYYEEVEEYNGDEIKDQLSYEYEELQAKAILDAKNQHTISMAERETAKASYGVSDRQKLTEIYDSTIVEKTENKKYEAFVLRDKNNNSHSNENENENEDEYIPAKSYIS